MTGAIALEGFSLVQSRFLHEDGVVLFGCHEESGAEARALQALREV
jgi:hypothetical protein